MAKKIIFLVILVTFLSLVYSLSRQVYDALRSGARLDQEVEELVKLQQKNSELKEKLTRTQTVKFIEEQTRDKLNMARAGETVMIIPQERIDQIVNLEKERKVEILLNWQGWLKLFWH